MNSDPTQIQFIASAQDYVRKYCIDQVKKHLETLYTFQRHGEQGQRVATSPQPIAIHMDAGHMSNVEVLVFMALQNTPRRALQWLDQACVDVFLETHTTNNTNCPAGSLSELPHVLPVVHARLHNFPDIYSERMPQSMDVNYMVQLTATITSVTEPHILLDRVREIVCRGCQRRYFLEARVETMYKHEALNKAFPGGACLQEGCGKKVVDMTGEQAGVCGYATSEGAASSAWRLTRQQKYQEVMVQKQVRPGTSSRHLPLTMSLFLEDDLVETLQPGEDIRLTALVLHMWPSLTFPENEPLSYNIIMLANHVESLSRLDEESEALCDQWLTQALYMNAIHEPIPRPIPAGFGISHDLEGEFEQFRQYCLLNPLRGRNRILESICPQLCGLYIVKFAVALLLAGSVSRRDRRTGDCSRAEPHILLVGDPGTAKSQFLKFVVQLLNENGPIAHSRAGGLGRGVFSSGFCASSAGLTATAIRETSSVKTSGGGKRGISESSSGGQWVMEAGALVLADGGVCCIDEFNCLGEEDKMSLHEAMEQQCISVAKAGLCVRLLTRCSVLAACNPKAGKSYNPEKDLSENLGVGTPLLSRFDLIIFLLDESHQAWNEMVTAHILQRAMADHSPNESVLVSSQMQKPLTSLLSQRTQQSASTLPLFNFEKLKAFFMWIRWKYRPVVSEEARTLLHRYYSCQRNQGTHRESSRTTMRLLESSIRLSVAHARLMMRNEVTRQDVVAVLALMESTLFASCLFEQSEDCQARIEGNVLHVLFPMDPEQEYKKQETEILRRMGMMPSDEMVLKPKVDVQAELPLLSALSREIFSQPKILPTLSAMTVENPVKTGHSSQLKRSFPSQRPEDLPKENVSLSNISNDQPSPGAQLTQPKFRFKNHEDQSTPVATPREPVKPLSGKVSVQTLNKLQQFACNDVVPPQSPRDVTNKHASFIQTPASTLAMSQVSSSGRTVVTLQDAFTLSDDELDD